MNIYLQEQCLFASKEQAVACALGLPPFALCQIKELKLSQATTLYQVIIYCFDDDVDTSYLVDITKGEC